MPEKFQNLVTLAFVSFLFVFVSCNKSDNDTDDTEGNKLHSYNIEFKSKPGVDNFTFTYGGSKTSTDQIGKFKEDMGSYGTLTLDFSHGTNLIKGGFILKENGAPLNLDFEGYQTLEASLFELHDSEKNRVFKGVFGTVTISNRNIEDSSNPVRAASYKVQFDGEFDLITDGGVAVRCIGTGKVEVGQAIQ